VTVSSALIRDSVGRILVFESQNGFAALPGGTREYGETAKETAIRETFEETGLRIDIEGTVASYNLTVLNKDGTERCKFRHYLFLASTTDTNARPSAEWSSLEAECTWTTLSGLKRYRSVWPLPEPVTNELSEGNLNLGNLGELTYRM